MAESSKKGTKRGKKAKLAMEAAMRSTSHVLSCISEPDSDDITHVGVHDTLDLPLVHGSQSEGLYNPNTTGSSIKSKNTCVPSLCKGMSYGPEKRINVQFNTLGQPIGDGSIKLSSYCGTLVRDMVPIIYDDWRKVPEEIKKNLWTLIKQKFNLDKEYQRKYVLGTMGSQLREYRSKLSKHIRKASKHDELNIDSLKPTGVDGTHWDMFTKKRLSEEFMEKSQKMKKIREAQLITHTTSRRGYARLEDKMKKESPTPSSITRVDVWQRGHTKKDGTPSNATVAERLEKIKEFTVSQQSSTASDMKDDAVSHIFGLERPGRVRGVGFGVTPSQLHVSLRGTSELASLRDENAGLKKEMAEVREQLATVMAWMAKQSGGAYLTPDSIQQTTSLQTPIPTVTQKTFKRDERVKLLDLHGSSIVVAIGRWMSNDPMTTVHNVPLREGGSQVAVLEAIVPRTPLWKDNNNDVENPTLEDVVGSIITWPTACITPF